MAIALAFRIPRKNDLVGKIMTIGGEIDAAAMGKTLIHEHFLVDFIGADKINPDRWNRQAVVERVLPFLLEAKKYGVRTVLDCTPAYLGRDVILLEELQKKSGLNILTNTGFYGAMNNKYLPPISLEAGPEELASLWISEVVNGIEGTGIRPGFIKISVDSNDGNGLSSQHKKLVRAAAITHLKTGLTICSHTGIAKAAFEELAILQQQHVAPSAFVWVHAQAEKDREQHIAAAKMGCWVSLDGIGWGDFDEYAISIANLKHQQLLDRVLISHDAGWYRPGEPKGGEFRGFTNIFTELFPRLKKKGFTDADFNQLLVKNPAAAFAGRVRPA